MGNYRFRLSDMMPNAWFYKLRDMSKSRTQPTNKKLPSPTQKSRKSLYHSCTAEFTMNPKTFDTHFLYDPPRKSSKKRSKRKTIYMPSPRQQQINPHQLFQEPEQDFLESPLSTDSCSCKLTSSVTDIIIDVDQMSYGAINMDNNLAEFHMISEPELPPILTKPAKHIPSEESPKIKNSHGSKKNNRKSVARSRGIKIRGNGPKLASRKSVSDEKKGLFHSESFAIVKASFDPERDFKDSMMEMIRENNIRTSQDLEDLLACYLSLNSNHYHHLIINAFEQIWFNM